MRTSKVLQWHWSGPQRAEVKPMSKEDRYRSGIERKTGTEEGREEVERARQKKQRWVQDLMEYCEEKGKSGGGQNADGGMTGPSNGPETGVSDTPDFEGLERRFREL